MTDEELLDEVLSKDITDDARHAFQHMREGLSRHHKLTQKQRAWVQGVAEAAGVDLDAPPAENLVSSGKMRVRPEERLSLAKFHQSLGPLPKKPPGRR